jgi:amino acid transporter
MSENTTTSGSPFYVRQATGLVREVGLGSNVAATLAFMSIPYGLFLATQAPFAFPGSNIVLIIVITAVLCLFPVLLYGLLGQAMPRSGGDYVFVSRILSPMVGFASSFNLSMWFLLVGAALAATIAPFSVAPALATIGVTTNNQSLLNAAADVSSKGWSFTIGAAVILLTVLLISFRLRVWMKIFLITFAFSYLGAVISGILTIVHGNADFQQRLSSFGASYKQILASAKTAGYAGGNHFSLGATMSATPLAASFFIFAIATVYYAGEIRAPSRTLLKGLLLALGAGMVTLLIVDGFAARTFGQNFLGSATYLSTVDPQNYPLAVPPSVYFFSSMLTTSTPLITIMNFSFLVALFTGFVITFFVVARNIFAWSFDRILPDSLASVNDKTRSPLIANVVILVIALAYLGLVVYGPSPFLTLIYTGVIGQILTMIVVAIAGAVFPWRRQELFKGSNIASHRILGAPAISVVGVVSLLIYLFFLIPLLTNDTLGANSKTGLIAVVVIGLSGFPIYWVSKVVNRRRGIDLGIAFTELPPE